MRRDGRSFRSSSRGGEGSMVGSPRSVVSGDREPLGESSPGHSDYAPFEESIASREAVARFPASGSAWGVERLQRGP